METIIDTLSISELRINATIGVHAWEQKIKQQLKLDINIPLDLSQCKDTLEHTLDYDKLCQAVTTFVESNQFLLIETVAAKVADLIQETFNVSHLTVSVSKPHAIKNAGNIKITVAR